MQSTMHQRQLRQAGASSQCRCLRSAPVLRPAHHLVRPPPIHSASTAVQPETAADEQPSSSNDSEYVRISQYVPKDKKTYSSPKITDSGTLRPSPLWYPAWMKYRRREDNYVFWQDKFSRNSMDIEYWERRWTVFSTFWYLVKQAYFKATPPALRYVAYLIWYPVQMKLYETHKAVVMLQCRLDAHLAAQATGALPKADTPIQLAQSILTAMRQHPRNHPHTPPQETAPGTDAATPGEASTSQSEAGPEQPGSTAAQASTGTEGSDTMSGAASPSDTAQQAGTAAPGTVEQAGPGFSKTMALRRLHWKNTLLAEVLYLVNVYKTGRVHLLPPVKKPLQRPTLFWLF